MHTKSFAILSLSLVVILGAVISVQISNVAEKSDTSLRAASNSQPLATVPAPRSAVESAEDAPLEPVSTDCGPASFSKYSCDFILFKPVWRSIESDYSTIKYDAKNIRAGMNGNVEVTVYAAPKGAPLNLDNLARVGFDCRGHAVAIQGSQILQIPVTGGTMLMGLEACQAAIPKVRQLKEEQRKLDEQMDYRATHPRPEDYCVGFDPESCAQIQKGVESPTKPEFCNLKFSSPDVAMSDINRRICYARDPVDNPL